MNSATWMMEEHQSRPGHHPREKPRISGHLPRTRNRRHAIKKPEYTHTPGEARDLRELFRPMDATEMTCTEILPKNR